MITESHATQKNLEVPITRVVEPSTHKKVKKSYLEALLNSTKEKSFRICVICEKYPDIGNGDLHFARKVAEFTQKRFEANTKVSLHGLHEYEMGFLNQSIRTILSPSIEILSTSEIPANDGKTLIIHGPVLKAPFPEQLSNDYETGDIFHISEYSFLGKIHPSAYSTASAGRFYKHPRPDSMNIRG